MTSQADASLAGAGVVYPNAVPYRPKPEPDKREEIVFSGNLEYEPNQTAIRWFLNSIWPAVRMRAASINLAANRPERFRNSTAGRE